MIDDSHTADERSAPEAKLWRGGPSQLLNFWAYLIDGLMVAGLFALSLWLRFGQEWGWALYLMPVALLPMLHACWKMLELNAWQYELSSQRIMIKRGVLSRRIDDLELYRVRDLSIEQPLHYRVLGLGNLVMETSDRSHPHMVIPAVAKPHDLLNLIRTNVEERRRVTRTREVDLDGGDELE